MKQSLKIFGQSIFVIISALFISSCASVPMADSAADLEAKSFKAPAGKSRIYVYRNEQFGSAIKMNLAVDGKIGGQTAPDVYYFWDLAPGTHEVTCLGDNAVSINVVTKENSVSYVWQEMKMGMFVAQCALHEVSAEEGQKGVNQCQLGFKK